MNGTASNDENTVDILPQLVNLNNISTSHFSDTKMKIDHHNLNNMDKEFAEEMVSSVFLLNSLKAKLLTFFVLVRRLSFLSLPLNKYKRVLKH